MQGASYSSNAQSIYTKDSVYLGEKEELLVLIRGETKGATITQNGVKIDVDKLWGCIFENIFPNIFYSEFNVALEKGNINELLLKEENYELFYDCSMNNIIVDSINCTFNPEGNDSIELSERKKNARKACILNYIGASNEANIIKDANVFCNCVVKKSYASSYNIGLNDIADENSLAYNEILLPCQKEVLDNNILYSKYNPQDIIGKPEISKIRLINDLNSGYKIKIRINNIVKYFLLDTGASDLIINEKIEEELITNGTISSCDSLGEYYYEMANGELELARVYRISKITIGDYTVNNAIVAVIDGGTLLCGTSFLNKFKGWNIISEPASLILIK
jgi:predicted aspartyl protease